MKDFMTTVPRDGGFRAAHMSWVDDSYRVASIESDLKRRLDDAMDIAYDVAKERHINAGYMRDCPYPFHHSVR